MYFYLFYYYFLEFFQIFLSILNNFHITDIFDMSHISIKFKYRYIHIYRYFKLFLFQYNGYDPRGNNKYHTQLPKVIKINHHIWEKKFLTKILSKML